MIVGIDADLATVVAAEHLLHEIVAGLGRPAVPHACTHLIRAGRPRVALSLELIASPATRDRALATVATVLPPEAALIVDDAPVGAVKALLDQGVHEAALLDQGAREAATAHAGRASGRAVIFDGVERLTGTLTVGTLLAGSCITRVVQLGGGEVAAEQVLETRDFVRPLWIDGQLTLPVMPARGGVVVPFEVPNPTPCCADH